MRSIVVAALSLLAAGCAAFVPQQSEDPAQQLAARVDLQLVGANPATDGCGPADALVVNGEDAATREPMVNVGPGRPIREAEQVTLANAREQGFHLAVPRDRKGRDVQYIGTATDQVTIYLRDEPVKSGESIDDFVAQGGVVITETRNREELAMFLPRGDGTYERIEVEPPAALATQVMVGPHDALLTRSDPIADGVQPWGLEWREGMTEWFVWGARINPRGLVEIARSMVCGE
jgi:hypothetical protein